MSVHEVSKIEQRLFFFPKSVSNFIGVNCFNDNLKLFFLNKQKLKLIKVVVKTCVSKEQVT